MGTDTTSPGQNRMPPAAPQVLCDTRALTGAPPDQAGALWRLAVPGRQLDANVVHLPPGHRVDTHTEADLDVLVLVVAGYGTVGAAVVGGAVPVADGSRYQRVAEGTLVWLPHGSVRCVAAGARGLSYLTVHARRPGLRIGTRPKGWSVPAGVDDVEGADGHGQGNDEAHQRRPQH